MSIPLATLATVLLGSTALTGGREFAISSLIRDAIKAVIWLAIAVAGGVAAYIWLTTGTEGLQTQIDNLFS